jgi:hypothetical protein
MTRKHGILKSAVSVAPALLIAAATCIASCSSTPAQPPQMELTNIQLSPAAVGSCKIDAVKMCQVTEGAPASPAAAQNASIPVSSSYGPPNLPDTVEFQIPAGQAIKLMCYYDPQRTSIYRADATAESPLTGNSVEYMKQRGFCVTK